MSHTWGGGNFGKKDVADKVLLNLIPSNRKKKSSGGGGGEGGINQERGNALHTLYPW